MPLTRMEVLATVDSANAALWNLPYQMERRVAA